MPFQPDAGDVHVDTLLSNISVGYRNKRYIATEIFPIVPVAKQSDIVPRYNKDMWLRESMRLRAPGGDVATSGYTVDNTLKYFCDNFALGKDIPDEIRLNADAPYDLDRDATMWLTEMVQIHWEKKFSADFFATGKWGTDFVESAAWSDYAGSDPIQDIRTMRSNVLSKSGQPANLLVTNNQVIDKLLDHPLIVERVKYTGGMANEALIAQLTRLERVLVGDAIEVTSQEGVTDVFAPIWGKHALVVYVPPAAGLFTPTGGYTFIWRPLVGGGAAPWFMRRIRDDKRKKDILEAHTYYDMLQVDATMGQLATSVIA